MAVGRVLRAVGRLAAIMLGGALWGFLVGVPIGVIGRTMMRAVALVGGLEPAWTAAFSLHLVFIIAVINAAMGLSYAVIRDVMPGGRRRGLVFGLIALAIAVYPGLLGEAHALVDEIGLAATAFGVTALSSLFLLDGVWLEALLRPRTQRQRSGDTAVSAGFEIAAPGPLDGAVGPQRPVEVR